MRNPRRATSRREIPLTRPPIAIIPFCTVMSYDQIKDTGARPLYVQQREAAGYQGANGANNLQHYNSPLPQVDHDQDVENDPSSLPVAHLNVSFFPRHHLMRTILH